MVDVAVNKLGEFNLEPNPSPFKIERKAKLPKQRKRRPECPPTFAKAMKEYATQYKAVYGTSPVMAYFKDFGFVRINGNEGVNQKRLKQLTQQLREKIRSR